MKAVNAVRARTTEREREGEEGICTDGKTMTVCLGAEEDMCASVRARERERESVCVRVLASLSKRLGI